MTDTPAPPTDTTHDRVLRRAAARATPRRKVAPIDDLDRQIIRVLQENARVPNTEIARTLEVTETTIRNRVNRLLEEELIEMVALITPRAQQATISAFVSLRINPPLVDAAIAILRDRHEVRFLTRMISIAQILAETFYLDYEHMATFQLDVLAQLPGIQQVDTSLVLRVEKASFEWEI